MTLIVVHRLSMASQNLYNLTVEDRAAYLYACVEAEVITLDIAVRYINETIGHLRKSEHSRMLFVRETPMMASKTQYSLIAAMIFNTLPSQARVALVDRSPAYPIVMECVNDLAAARQRDVQAFDSVDPAEAWLLQTA
ncbi:MAG: hypothetical protein ACJ73D_00005 [Pyrinomonadaceae bacterium]